MRITSQFIVAVFVLATCPMAWSQVTVGIRDYATVPAGSRLSVMTSDPAGRVFVNDQNGPLYSIDRTTRAATPYLNLNTATYPALGLTSGGESGFQSFAFHPDFYTAGSAGAGKFYTMFSSTQTGVTPDFNPGGGTAFHSVLLEWTASNPAATTFQPANAAAPYREVARFNQPFGNHNAGLISFNTSAALGSADRNNLYVALGDGGSGGDPQGNGQNAGNPYGAILRIDPTGSNSVNGKYGIVADNVLAADGNSATLAENYSTGLRNPQRFGWDSATGTMYIADIGQGAFEEINRGVNGGNFGWATREGSQGGNAPGAIDPIAQYDHGAFVTNAITGNKAVTMGDVVRGSPIADLNGKLILGDFPNGVIYTLDVDNDPLAGGSAGLQELTLLDENGQSVRMIDLIRNATGNQSLGRADIRFSYGLDGEVFVTNKFDGVIRQLVVAVPEPGSLMILMVGLVAAGVKFGFVRSKRKTS